eukprot:m.51902 g.51902  ORF g.51902 m.51902 type:complete len:294 (+) comp10762_c0_seq2:112-993(+)
MSKASAGNRGAKKTKSKGGGGATVTRQKKMQTSQQDHIMTLRAAIYDTNGKDKDVTKNVIPFLKYNRNELDLEIEFAVKPSSKTRAKCIAIEKEHYGEEEEDEEWEQERDEDLRAPANRFLIFREKRKSEDDGLGDIVGFLSFRFSIQGELVDEMVGKPTLVVFDFFLRESIQRKGLGRHVINMLQLIAKKENISFIQFAVPEDCEGIKKLLTEKCGFIIDTMDYCKGSMEEGMEVYTKEIGIKASSAVSKQKSVASVPIDKSNKPITTSDTTKDVKQPMITEGKENQKTPVA